MNYKRFIRYIYLYGPSRSLIKAAYHLNNALGNLILNYIFNFKFKKGSERIFIAGLGNHGFTLISYAVIVVGRRSISGVIDPSERAKFLAKKILRCDHFYSLAEAVGSGRFFGDILYICSDHQSHMVYALAAVGKFSNVYIEKPLIVSRAQVPDLVSLANSKVNVFTGFNRSNAPYTKHLIEHCGNIFNITFVVNGHFLPADHWYRDDGQGSRVLGNLTHWLDLSYRILIGRDTITPIDIYMIKGHLDDVSIVLKQCNRTINICFSANSEPIDGVEEFIYWNSLTSTGFIDNFRKLILFNGFKKVFKKKLRKDVGHIQTILMPLNGDSYVDTVFVASALFCLSVEVMFKSNSSYSRFSPMNNM